MDKKQVLIKMEQNEKLGKLNEHVCPINYNSMLKVEDNYNYLRPGFFNKIGKFFARELLKLASLIFSSHFKLKVYGKENIKGIKKAIITSNHISYFDCALIKKPFFRKKIYYTVGEFNNFKGIGGSLLRCAGTMPFSGNFEAMKNFIKATKILLQKDNFIVFYPEGALWWCYEKPRPMYNGAFMLAVKNEVPIIPLFFTFKNLKKKKDGSYKKRYYLHIGKPIYIDKQKSSSENIKILKEKNFKFCKNVYEDFYGKKLKYECGDININAEINNTIQYK